MPELHIPQRKRGPKPIAERFWAKVARGEPDACWPWLASTNIQGYGKMGRGGQGDGTVAAHRLSYELRYGPIPDGLFVLHRCDNPPCVNPGHLFLGTQKDNGADMAAKGRAIQGKHNAIKTHCPRGHLYDEVNTRWRGNGRHCRACEPYYRIRYNRKLAASRVQE